MSDKTPRRIETYEPKRRTEEDHRRLIRAMIERSAHDPCSRAFRPASHRGPTA